VIFIVHGWFGHVACAGWQEAMKDAILEAEDATVILVYWSMGALHPLYNVPATTTTTVSDAIAAVAKGIYNSATFKGKKDGLRFYCIGHSLGGQICGQVGKKAYVGALQLFDRVTSLDPAGAGFDTCSDHDYHVDNTSATCVEVIHTDGTMKGHASPTVHEGTMVRWGHIDFYPNGGQDQPACSPLSNDVGCSHATAFYYFIDTIKYPNMCQAVGPCSNPDDPSTCGNNTQSMGFYSSCYNGTTTSLSGAYYVKTVAPDATGPGCKSDGMVRCIGDMLGR